MSSWHWCKLVPEVIDIYKNHRERRLRWPIAKQLKKAEFFRRLLFAHCSAGADTLCQIALLRANLEDDSNHWDICQKRIISTVVDPYVGGESDDFLDVESRHFGVDTSHSALEGYVKGLGSDINFYDYESFDVISETSNLGGKRNLSDDESTSSEQGDSKNKFASKPDDQASAASVCTHSTFSFNKYVKSVTTEGSIISQEENSLRRTTQPHESQLFGSINPYVRQHEPTRHLEREEPRIRLHTRPPIDRQGFGNLEPHAIHQHQSGLHDHYFGRHILRSEPYGGYFEDQNKEWLHEKERELDRERAFFHVRGPTGSNKQSVKPRLVV